MNTNYNTLIPYKEIERDDIQYTYCYDYQHISRYRGLRQVIHQGLSSDRYIALETSNPFETNTSLNDVFYYTVPERLANRLDLIAQDKLGSASYAWVIAYFNNIADGYTAPGGTTLRIPKNISTLFNNGELLAPVSVNSINLGSE